MPYDPKRLREDPTPPPLSERCCRCGRLIASTPIIARRCFRAPDPAPLDKRKRQAAEFVGPELIRLRRTPSHGSAPERIEYWHFHESCYEQFRNSKEGKRIIKEGLE